MCWARAMNLLCITSSKGTTRVGLQPSKAYDHPADQGVPIAVKALY